MSAKIYDTLLWEYIKNPGIKWLSLDKLSKRKLNYEMINFDDLVKKQKLANFSEVELKSASKYSAEDVYITYKIFETQELTKKEKEILNEIDFLLIYVLKDMEIDWVKISRDRLKELWIILKMKLVD